MTEMMGLMMVYCSVPYFSQYRNVEPGRTGGMQHMGLGHGRGGYSTPQQTGEEREVSEQRRIAADSFLQPSDGRLRRRSPPHSGAQGQFVPSVPLMRAMRRIVCQPVDAASSSINALRDCEWEL